MSQLVPPPAPPRPATAAPILRASGLAKSFKIGDQTVGVLRRVDLSLQPGELVAIEGRSGSGKSTLLHILAGLDAADAGSVELDGVDLAPMAAATDRQLGRLRRLPGLAWLALLLSSRADRKLAHIRNTQFGFVFQFYHLLPELDVLENTLLAPMIQHSWLGYHAKRRELTDRAKHVLTQLGMEHRLHQSPNRLSGGERQRVAIARALMNSPRVLFADEPTGNLDAETGRQIMGVLEQLHQERGQTIVMVTHDRTLAREADRVLVMKDGKLERAES